MSKPQKHREFIEPPVKQDLKNLHNDLRTLDSVRRIAAEMPESRVSVVVYELQEITRSLAITILHILERENLNTKGK